MLHLAPPIDPVFLLNSGLVNLPHFKPWHGTKRLPFDKYLSFLYKHAKLQTFTNKIPTCVNACTQA